MSGAGYPVCRIVRIPVGIAVTIVAIKLRSGVPDRCLRGSMALLNIAGSGQIIISALNAITKRHIGLPVVMRARELRMTDSAGKFFFLDMGDMAFRCDPTGRLSRVTCLIAVATIADQAGA